jgi:hypothetical protein
MPGGFFPHSGSNVPTNTVWFGTICDRLNMLWPWDGATTGGPGGVPPATWTPIPNYPGAGCTYANQWPLTAATLGALSNGPDGTNTAQLIKEDTSNGKHFISACPYSPQPFAPTTRPTGTFRLAGYFKYAGRRLVLQAEYFPVNMGVYAVFDLANGAIGVPPTVFGVSALTNLPVATGNAQIYPAGGGWFRCEFDFCFNTYEIAPDWEVEIYLDNGIGSAARSYSYIGDGASGVIGWRTNLMPVGAYGINNTVMFEDFLDLNGIDVNNTKVAVNPSTGKAYNFFVDANFAQWVPFQVVQPSSMSVASSVLTVTSPATPGIATTNPPSLVTWTNSGFPANSPGVGRGFRPPYLFEINVAYGVDAVAWSGGTSYSAFWTIGGPELWQKMSNYPNPGNPPPPYSALPIPGLNMMEIDYGEIRGGFANAGVPHIGCNFWWGTTGFSVPQNGQFPPTGNAGGSIQSTSKTPLYQVLNNYSGNFWVVNGSDGIRYRQATGFIPAGNPPPNVTYWNVSNFPSAQGPLDVELDVRQFNTWSTIVLPWHGSPGGFPSGINSAGMCLSFFNGLFVGLGITWTPFWQQSQNIDTSGYCQCEYISHVVFLSHDCNASAPGVPHHYDWVRIMQ